MALKLEVESLEGLDDGVKPLYEEKDGKYVLSVDGVPDVSGYEERIKKMDAKIEELLGEKKTAVQKAREKEQEAIRAAEEAARKNGDTEALEKSWQEKLSAKESELTALVEEREAAIQGLTVSQTAVRIAAEIAEQDSVRLVEREIESRLRSEVKEGKAQVYVLDKDGKRSAMTVDELRKEIENDPAFARIIKATNATGGGAGGSKGGKGGADMTTTEKHQLYRDNPVRYRQLFGE